MHIKSGDLKKAYSKFLQTLFLNPYVIARVIGIDYELPFTPGSNIPTRKWSEYVPEEIYNLWDEESKAWLKVSFYLEKTQALLARYHDIGKQIESLPVGAKRSKLIEELFGMMQIEVE